MLRHAKSWTKAALQRLPKNRVGDKAYHAAMFYVAHRRAPKRESGLFNDYLFFLKTDEDFASAHRQFVSDKDLVKIYYRGVLGDDLAPRTLAKFHSYEDFISAKLPAPCVIKPAHLSGCIFHLNKDSELRKDQLDLIASWFTTNIYEDISRERNYRLLRPSVICEELTSDPKDVHDYKLFCFNGRPKAIQVDVDRHSAHKRRMYTTDWTPLNYSYNKPLADTAPPPALLPKALQLAEKLSAGFEFIRVDVYLSSDRVWLGELTSVPENAHGRFESINAEREFSKLIFS